MAILVGKDTKVLVQAMTGKSGSLQTKAMLEAGTRIVAGVTPGKGGQELYGFPSMIMSRRRRRSMSLIP